MKLFDCHSHIHLGPRGLAPLLESMPQPLSPALSAVKQQAAETSKFAFAGAAIMSTHPRDYAMVDSLVLELRRRDFRAVPCYGIHPWFLNEVLLESNSMSNNHEMGKSDDDWYNKLKQRLQKQPDAIVGEIGLDGARWVEVEDELKNSENNKDDSIWKRTRILACPMDLQQKAFEDQLFLAAELQRPVSVHVVRAWGELFDSFDTVRERMKQKYNLEDQRSNPPENETANQSPKKRKSTTKRLLLPPKIYFHAFSGKEGVIPSLLSACAKGNIDPEEDVFFGFAPAIPNFHAPKTPSVMKRIGINRLLIETDVEDASRTWEDLIEGVRGLSDAFHLELEDVANITYGNAERFYCFSDET
ncbi:hypothetical protein ACHAXS_010390 [Conticribra weissflogii]